MRFSIPGLGGQGKREVPLSDNAILAMAIGRVMFFPLLLAYLELTLHLFAGADMQYFTVWLLFAISFGFLLSSVTMPFKRRVNRILVKVLTPLITLLYIVELVAKRLLQNFYPFSTVGLAAENHLSSYADTLFGALPRLLPAVLLMLLPTLFLFLFGNQLLMFPRTDIRFSGLAAGLMVIFHLLGLLVVHLPWSGDLTPSLLYAVDTNLDDQVEQLGLVTMLRLDLKHLMIPAGTLSESGAVEPEPDMPSTWPSAEPSPSEKDGELAESAAPTVYDLFHIMDVDLDAVAASTENEDIQWLANYFNSRSPTEKNEYTGIFAGYNVIFLTLEGFSGYAIREDLTPTLYRLTQEGFVFENFYTALHYTSTSGGECQNLLGLYPKAGNPVSLKRTGELGTNCYFSLAQQLGRLGYANMGYHGNTDMYGRYESHTNLGYTWKQYGTGLELEMNADGTDYLWPQRDKYIIDVSVGDYINSSAPFNVYYMTISGHMPYSNNRVAQQYRDLVDPLPYSDTTKNYLATCIEVDRAFETLLDDLDAAGKLDQTLIVACADHIPYFNVDTLEELSGLTFGSSEDLENLNESSVNPDVYRNSLILWSASMEEPIYVDKVCCQVDILPTVSNLLGLEYDSRMLSGSDILSDAEGQVIFSSRSWLTDTGFYSRYTGEFAPAEGIDMTDAELNEYVARIKNEVGCKLDCTARIIETNFYDYVFNQFQADPEPDA